ncbi:amidohydrolase family protein [Sphingomonas sp. AOB5]|uniref:amidohydrolase family protein n=1 Tax=Sphingomonas sp. AOB5 TaxID=3034017 RepID=UPI0023F99C9A|nr:amidohydrolase family protein [Sphingomonas sp. AOB5]MDF7774781.1 amidohydrolase family protein [Sphingomonas sp. AOB5]
MSHAHADAAALAARRDCGMLPDIQNMGERMTGQRSLAELDRWHAGHVEDVIDPGRRIVDAHHHMWQRPPEAYQLPELMAELESGHDVRATVFVQNNAMYRAGGPEAMKPLGETEYVNGVAAVSASGMFGPQRLCAGIVGHADLRLGKAVRPVLEAHRRASGRFRGIRHQAQWDGELGSMARIAAPKGLLLDPDFRKGFAELGPLGLRFDAWIYFHQLGELASLAGAFPETPVILDHLGAPLGVGPYAARRNEVFDLWAAGIRALAKHSNVSVKLGGLGMPSYGFGFGFETRAAPATSAALAEAWRPYVELVIEAFGANRCMFESNFPVDKVTCSYRTLWNALKRIAEGTSEAEKAALFDGTARRVYDLGSEGIEN